MTRYLTTEQALKIARHAVGRPVHVRDVGLLDAASIARARASSARTPTRKLMTKAAALLHSVARNDPLVDGNKRLAWLATYVFLAKNGVELDPGDGDAYALVVAVASDETSDVAEIASALGGWVKQPEDPNLRRPSARTERTPTLPGHDDHRLHP